MTRVVYGVPHDASLLSASQIRSARRRSSSRSPRKLHIQCTYVVRLRHSSDARQHRPRYAGPLIYTLVALTICCHCAQWRTQYQATGTIASPRIFKWNFSYFNIAANTRFCRAMHHIYVHSAVLL